jgi:hypothetical protein
MQTTALLHYIHGVQSASKLSSITTFTTITEKRKSESTVSQIHIKLLQMIPSVLQCYMFPIILFQTA